ncbi:MAG: hypothetical protein ACYTF8_03405 [Planctomycetota bacterium]
MRPHDKVHKLLSKVEPVEWLYDGLNGKIIPWTLENGGKSKDPSVQAFLVARDGTVFSRCPDGRAHSASGFSSWLRDEIGKFEKKYPRTAFRFDAPDMDLIDGRPASESFMAAQRGDKPILLYAGRDSADPKDRKARKEVKAARKFEKGTLSSTKAAEAAQGYVLFKIDLADERQAKWAKTKGIEKAPTLLLFLPGERAPIDLSKVKGNSLAYHLKKHAPE